MTLTMLARARRAAMLASDVAYTTFCSDLWAALEGDPVRLVTTGPNTHGICGVLYLHEDDDRRAYAFSNVRPGETLHGSLRSVAGRAAPTEASAVAPHRHEIGDTFWKRLQANRRLGFRAQRLGLALGKRVVELADAESIVDVAEALLLDLPAREHGWACAACGHRNPPSPRGGCRYCGLARRTS